MGFSQGDSHIKKNSGICRQILLLFTGILIIFSLFVGILFAVELFHPDSRRPPRPVSREVDGIVRNVNEGKNDSMTQQNHGLIADFGLLRIAEFFFNVRSTVKDFFNASSLSEDEKFMIDTNSIYRSSQQPPIQIRMGSDYTKEEELIEEVYQEDESDHVIKPIITLISQEKDDFKHFH